jgi:hypothetical protein
MPRSNAGNGARVRACIAAGLLTMAAGGFTHGIAPAAQTAEQSTDVPTCGLSGGTLTTALTPDNDSDFVVFGLYDDKGDEIAKQLVPVYSPSASAEVMVTQIGFAGSPASAKCLADSPARRCNDPKWDVEDGLMVSLAGLLIGPDFTIATIGARYKRPASTAQLAIDGGIAGFQLDKGAVHWAAFFNSQQEVSQAFFDIPPGDHTLTMGSRDPQTAALLPQERVCFRT